MVWKADILQLLVQEYGRLEEEFPKCIGGPLVFECVFLGSHLANPGDCTLVIVQLRRWTTSLVHKVGERLHTNS